MLCIAGYAEYQRPQGRSFVSTNDHLSLAFLYFPLYGTKKVLYNSIIMGLGVLRMHCMKCGRKIEDQKVFCTDCLAEMENTPVNPDTVIHLPVRPALPVAKKKARRGRDGKPEDQLRHLKFVVRCLCVALAVCLVAFALSAGMLLKMIDDRDSASTIGQNYGTIGNND